MTIILTYSFVAMQVGLPCWPESNLVRAYEAAPAPLLSYASEPTKSHDHALVQVYNVMAARETGNREDEYWDPLRVPIVRACDVGGLGRETVKKPGIMCMLKSRVRKPDTKGA